MSSHRAITLIALAATLIVGAVTPAAAMAPKYESHVSLKIINGFKFKGEVTSEADDCVVGRKVQLWRKSGPGDFQKVAKTFASESGQYSITIPMQEGNTFQARVLRKETPLGNICLADKSAQREA